MSAVTDRAFARPSPNVTAMVGGCQAGVCRVLRFHPAGRRALQARGVSYPKVSFQTRAQNLCSSLRSKGLFVYCAGKDTMVKEAMHTMASKNSAANGSDRASAWIGKAPSSTPASRLRWMFSEALNHRSVLFSNKTTLTPCLRRSRRGRQVTLSRPTGEGTARPVAGSFPSSWIRRLTEDDSPSPIRWDRVGVRASVPPKPKLFLHGLLDAHQLPACSIFAAEKLVRFGQVRDFHAGSVKEQPPATQAQ